ncbi:hypothetical protein HMPREF3213_01837 [Heyndrickxia coagulans]|uniref:Uncharacterized protein n=1 Tax=Heyndrickxia coagulans TaxID=1398 RepID=A0A133KQH5_HEYCO|nr:hypothetical protein HMPREF3213_01837 [Heyndrickxia coagulans]
MSPVVCANLSSPFVNENPRFQTVKNIPWHPPFLQTQEIYQKNFYLQDSLYYIFK